MSLVPSLLQAIVRVDGEALVMHVGEKPYVVSPNGQVDLATRGLTFEAVTGIVAQLLPPPALKALEDVGATQYELPAFEEFPGEHFTVTAARGGEDVWAEIRRRQALEDDLVADDVFGDLVSQPATDSSMSGPDDLSLPREDQLWPEPPAAAAIETFTAERVLPPTVKIRPLPEETEPALPEETAPALPQDTGLPLAKPAEPAAAATRAFETDTPPVEALVESPTAEAVHESPMGEAVRELPTVEAVAELPMVEAVPESPAAEAVDEPEAEMPAASETSSAEVGTALPPQALVMPETAMYTVAPPEPIAPSKQPSEVFDSLGVGPVRGRTGERPEVPEELAASNVPPPAASESSTSASEGGVSTGPAASSTLSVEPLLAALSELVAAQTPSPLPSVQPTVVERPVAVSPPAPIAAAEPVPAVDTQAASPSVEAHAAEPSSEAVMSTLPPEFPSPLFVTPTPVTPTAAPPRDQDSTLAAGGPAFAPFPALTEAPHAAVVVPIGGHAREVGGTVSELGPAALERLLRLVASRGASALYLSSNARPSVRLDGDIQALDGTAALAPHEIEALLLGAMQGPAADALRAGVAGEWVWDLADVGRVRCTSFHDHRGPGAVFRIVSVRPLSASQLGLSREIQALGAEPDGLLLVAGPRANGKSTLLAAFVDLINRTRRDFVVTLEKEINVVHERQGALVSQREVRGSADDMLAAARAALREDPDVLVLEDLRGAALVSVALDAAAAGQLVIAGVTAHHSAGALDRLIELYQPEHRRQAYLSLAQCLRGVVTQVLLRKSGGGRVAAREVLLNTPMAASLLAEGRTAQLPLAIEGGRKHGMVPLNDALVGFVQSGVVDVREAYRRAADRAGLLDLLKRQGIDTSFVERFA